MEKIKDIKALKDMGQVFIMVPDSGCSKYRVTPLENVECDFNDRQIRRRLGFSWEVIKNSPVKGIYGTLEAMQRSRRVSFHIEIKDSSRVYELEEAIAPKCCKCSKRLHVQEGGCCLIELCNGFQYGENAMVDIGIQEGVEIEVKSNIDPEKDLAYNSKNKNETQWVVQIEKYKKLFYNGEWIYSFPDRREKYFHRASEVLDGKYVIPVLAPADGELVLSHNYDDEDKAVNYINSPKGYFVEKLESRKVVEYYSPTVQSSDCYASEDTYYTPGRSSYNEDVYGERVPVTWKDIPEEILKDMRWILQDLGRQYKTEEEREAMNERFYLRSIEEMKDKMKAYIDRVKVKNDEPIKEKKSWISDYL